MNDTTDATAIFAPIWRRKWLILAVGIIVAAASYAYYKGRQHIYQASTQIYLGAAAEEQLPGEKVSRSQAAAIASQATIINSIVVEQVRRRLIKEQKRSLVKGSKVRATAPEKSEFVTITVEGHTAQGVALLANATARAYIARQRDTRQRAIEKAIAISRRQLHRIEAASISKAAPNSTAGGKSATGKATAPTASNVLQEANLSSQINKLESNLTQTGAQQIKPATAATAQLLSPKPRQNAIFGFVIGIVLAAIAAYALSRLDRRLRSLAAIEATLRSQILVGLPKVRRPIVRREGQPTPSRFLVEPLRRLHTVLQVGAFAQPQAGPRSRVILFVSPDPGDGKSTLVADLALTQRDAGERVTIVEANFRRPAQARLLGLDAAHGLADALEGRMPLDQAIQRVHPIQPADLREPSAAANPVATLAEPATASLFVLAGGGPVANPPALLASPAMAELLGSIAADSGYVLIDAPSPLEFSDVMPLLALVDGVVIVARVAHTREGSAERLAQLLGQSGAPVLGTVANCVPRKEIERYGFSTSDGRAWSSKLIGR
jgi:Mrp family chromosome partitioning ATPase/capsular polysaccharide biosynthesis protein